MQNSLRILMWLAVLLGTTGVAAAQNVPCPECDADGESSESNYGSIDAGLVVDEAEALADTDAATSHENTGGGFFAWLSICLSLFVQKIGDAVGMDLDANAEVFADSEGVDLDATVVAGDEVFDFDGSPMGDLDGATYDAINDVEGATGLDVSIPNALPETGDMEVDVCVAVEFDLVACG